MTRYDKFKALSQVRDKYILESMPDHLGLQTPKRRGASAVSRFFNSGWGVACICAVVALSVMAVILRVGQDPWGTPAGTVDDPSVTVTDAPETEAESSAETVFDPSTLDLDTYQGMTPDMPYKITYLSNGDGTCRVSGITVNILYEGSYTVNIPETSPDGDTVVGLSLTPSYNIPAYIPAEDFEKIRAAVLDFYRDTPDQTDEEVARNNFYYKLFMSYFQLKGLEFCSTPELKEELLQYYPVCEYTNVYALDPKATAIDLARTSSLIALAAPWYTAEWCYADLLKIQKMAGEHNITDPNVEKYLSGHSDHLKDAVTVKLPKTLTGLSVTDPEIMLYMGITSLTYDGTMEEFRAFFNMESSIVPPSMVVHCIDGDISYPANAE